MSLRINTCYWVKYNFSGCVLHAFDHEAQVLDQDPWVPHNLGHLCRHQRQSDCVSFHGSLMEAAN